MSAFESISKGLNEALAHAEGTNTDSQTHEVKVPQVNVCEVRHATGLSQIAFARRIGVAKGTLVNWEQGRRHPTAQHKYSSLSSPKIRTWFRTYWKNGKWTTSCHSSNSTLYRDNSFRQHYERL